MGGVIHSSVTKYDGSGMQKFMKCFSVLFCNWGLSNSITSCYSWSSCGSQVLDLCCVVVN
jgi:hypothetical protein